jgi:membrane associated rhomboid family serine protease
MNLLDEIKLQFKNGSVLTQLIGVNLLVFVFVNILHLISFLSGNTNYWFDRIIDWLTFPASLNSFFYKPWSLLSYMFLHENLFHLLFNLLFLYFGGRLFIEFLGHKRLFPVYVLGGVSGALLFMLSYNLFPVFSNDKYMAVTLGASASALAILITIAAYLPDYVVYLLLVGPVKLKWVAVIVVLLDLFSITGGNAGGHIAHIGGAMFGVWYGLGLAKGKDYLSSVTNFFERLLIKHNRTKKLKIVHQNKKSMNSNKPNQEVIDKILDKISRSGYNSLSKEEKEILFKYSKEE